MGKDFKEFVLRGNVLDLAVGVIIGAAFGAIVTSLVNDLIMPPVGLLFGDVDFTDYFLLLKAGADTPPPYATLADAQAAGAVTWNYGLFITRIISFLLVALVVFMMVRAVARMRRKEEAKPPEAASTRECPWCATSIAVKARRCPNCTSELAPAGA